MYPENMLDLSRSIASCANFSPIHAGMLPKNLFCPRSMKVSSGQFCKNEGNSLERLLLSSLRVRIDMGIGVSELESVTGDAVPGEPMVDLDAIYSEHRGSSPVIKLFAISNNVKSFIWHIDGGITPVK